MRARRWWCALLSRPLAHTHLHTRSAHAAEEKQTQRQRLGDVVADVFFSVFSLFFSRKKHSANDWAAPSTRDAPNDYMQRVVAELLQPGKPETPNPKP